MHSRNRYMYKMSAGRSLFFGSTSTVINNCIVLTLADHPHNSLLTKSQYSYRPVAIMTSHKTHELCMCLLCVYIYIYCNDDSLTFTILWVITLQPSYCLDFSSSLQSNFCHPEPGTRILLIIFQCQHHHLLPLYPIQQLLHLKQHVLFLSSHHLQQHL